MKKMKVLFVIILSTLIVGCSATTLQISQGDGTKSQIGTNPDQGENQSNTTKKPKANVSEPENSKGSSNENDNGDLNNSMGSVMLVEDISCYSSKNFDERKDLVLGGDPVRGGFTLQGFVGDYCAFNLKGEYKHLSGIIGNEDGPSSGDFELSVYGDGDELATYSIKAGKLPVDISLDIQGVKELKFEVIKTYAGYTDTLGFGNMTLKK